VYRRIPIPLVAIGVIVVVGIVFLISQQATTPACGAFVVAAGAPATLDGGTSVALVAGSGELRFDSAALTEADLTDEANAQALAAVNAMPVNLRAEGLILTFTRCNEEPAPVHLVSPAPPSAALRPPQTAGEGRWQARASLDAYAWDGAQWTWLTGAADQLSIDLPDLPMVMVWVETLSTAPAIGTEPDLQTGGLAPEYYGVITELYEPGLTVAANGSLNGQVPAAPPEGAPYVAYPLVTNVANGQADAATVEAMLNDEAARRRHVETLASIASESNFAGVAIDYQGLSVSASDSFAALVEELATALHANGKTLIVRQLSSGPESQTDGDSLIRIGRAADFIQVKLGPDAPAYLDDGTVPGELTWMAQRISRSKLQPVISAASLIHTGGTRPLSFQSAVQMLIGDTRIISASAGISLTLSPNPSATLTSRAEIGAYDSVVGPDSDLSVYTAATLATKINALLGLGLRGAVINDIQGPDAAPNLLEPIKAYRQQSAITGSSDLSVDWTITAADGSVVLSESRPLVSADLVWTPASDGVYTATLRLPHSLRLGTSRSPLPSVGDFAGQASTGSVTKDVAVVTVGEGGAETGAGGGGTDTPSTPEAPCLNAVYVADVTVPDNTRFDKGKDFTKTWKVRNSGTCAWSADTELAFVRGAQLGASSPVKVGALEPGKTIDVSVPMESGDKDGAFTGIWRLRNEDGAFGDELSVVIKVGAEVVAPPPVAPPAGGGPTQYGIHSHYYGYVDTEAGAQSIVNYTNELGLGWTKIQFRWGDYDYYCAGPDLNRLNTMISAANGAGLKVLLSIVTSPPCTHPWTSDVHAPPDDPAALAELAGGLADLFKGRIHAIEVWNEQNISREWLSSPQKLDAARYTQLLAAAYNAIKAKDPNILVISGALAPTGWNDGVNAIDDFEYLKQMVAAGATKVMDCVGTHVNALRVPPSASLGGPYDNVFSPPHHSWYFKDTVLGYQSITGKPACVTEFGVASSQTIGQVEGFEWANENTQQEQADWVTEGMSLCKQWGCRLVILWNLDYGPVTRLVTDNALYSFIDIGLGRRPVFHAVKSWCAANGCR